MDGRSTIGLSALDHSQAGLCLHRWRWRRTLPLALLGNTPDRLDVSEGDRKFFLGRANHLLASSERVLAADTAFSTDNCIAVSHGEKSNLTNDAPDEHRRNAPGLASQDGQRHTDNMRLALMIGLLFTAATMQPAAAIDRQFGGNDCTDDCSGHKAGYEWAESKGITDHKACQNELILSSNSTSFAEGCETYTEEPYRGSDEDDDGKPID